MSLFEGVHPVLHLPIADDGQVCLDSFRPQVDRMISFGVGGVVTLGLATEAWTLDERERDAVCAASVDAVAGRVPVTAGVDGDTQTALVRGARALEAGASALMVRPPHGLSPAGVADHYTVIAQELDAPVLVQDAPLATGVDLTAEDLLRICERHPHLRSAKIEASPAGPKVSRLSIAGIAVVAGWGGIDYVDAMRRGAIGVMPGCDLAPALARIHELGVSGQWVAAQREYAQILPLLAYESQSLELLIVGAKLALHRAGVLPSPRMRQASDVGAVHAETFGALFDDLTAAGVQGW
jgi:4-hydroxy-tetrahydrodipicolinate synthase